jgi:hypothetical protein
MSVDEAAAVCDHAREGLPEADGPVPAFEVWRERIRNMLRDDQPSNVRVVRDGA